MYDLRYTAFSEPLINVNDENNNNLHILLLHTVAFFYSDQQTRLSPPERPQLSVHASQRDGRLVKHGTDNPFSCFDYLTYEDWSLL